MSQRLNQLIREHSLTTLANRVGVPISNVHRYARGGGMPSEFVAALAERLSVNPMWLLVGEGATYLTDAGDSGGALAAGLRDLIEAMNATSRLKLGTLAHRKDLGLVRSLTESAARHAELRGRLHRQVEPVAKEWFAAWRGAIERRDRGRADDLQIALERLLGLSDDPSLRREYDRLCAYNAYVQGRRADAVDMQRRNLLLRMAETGGVDEPTLRECFNLCAALVGLGRVQEARNFAEAILVIHGRDVPDTPVARMVRGMLGMCEISLGAVGHGTELIVAAYSTREHADNEHLALMMAFAMVRTGVLSPAAVLREFPTTVSIVVEVLRAAACLENAEELKEVLGQLRALDANLLVASHLYGVQAEFVLAAIKRKRRSPDESAFEPVEARMKLTPFLGELEVTVLRCQRARLVGKRTAVGLALDAEELLARTPRGISVDDVVLATHAHNVLALVQGQPSLKGAAERATDYLSLVRSRGLGLLR